MAGHVTWVTETPTESSSVSVHPYTDAYGHVTHVRTSYVHGVETSGRWRTTRVETH